jgi:chemotaxis protein MotA
MNPDEAFRQPVSGLRSSGRKPGGLANGGKHLLGILACFAVFAAGFFIHGNVSIFFNLSGFLIVVSGTLGATLISYRIERLKIVYTVLVASYRSREKSPDEIVEILVDLSVKCKIKGLLSLQEDEQETSVMFLRHALGLLVDGYPNAQIRDLLTTEMFFFKARREETQRVLRSMAEICPAFGLVGSVVGLIAMLVGVGDTSVILATVPIALTSTLYGVVFAYFFFLPFAWNIQDRTDRELLLQKIILEGVVAIGSDLHPRVLEKKLKSFLTPSARKVNLVSLKRIQEKFNISSAETVSESEAPVPDVVAASDSVNTRLEKR